MQNLTSYETIGAGTCQLSGTVKDSRESLGPAAFFFIPVQTKKAVKTESGKLTPGSFFLTCRLKAGATKCRLRLCICGKAQQPPPAAATGRAGAEALFPVLQGESLLRLPILAR